MASIHLTRTTRYASRLIALALLTLVCTSGCTGLRLPAIDPSGERIFLPAPNFTTFDKCSSCFGGNRNGPAWTSAPQAPLCGTPGASTAVVPYSLNTPTPPLYGPFTTPNPYAQPAPLGAGQSPQLSGVTSINPRDGLQGRLTLSPTRLTVPVGQEVIVRAAICGHDGYLMTGEPLEWSLAPNSVGTIVEVDQQNKRLWRQLFQRPPFKRAANFAQGLTSRAPQVVPRGTPSPYDDLQLARGETWISLTSASPGETHLHCLAPTVAGWEQRRASTTIQWVGGPSPQSPYPTPANPSTPGNVTIGPPIPGYPGTPTPPSADTQPALPTTIPTPAEPARPAAQPDVGLTITGPRTAKADQELTYRINVRNAGQADARDVEVSSKIPFGLRFVQSDPPANVFGDRLVWRIGTLPPGQSRDITMRHVGERGGDMRVCAALDYRGANRTEECATTNIELNALSVDVRGPTSARIGSSLPLQILVTNHSDRTLNNVILRDEYSSGLYHPDGPSPIETNIGSIGPGQSRNLPIEFQVRGAGKLCQRVSVKSDDGSQASTESCIDAGGPSGGTPSLDGPAFGGPMLGGPENRFVVQKTGPYEMGVGARGLFKIQITNTGQVPLNGLQVVDEFDERIAPLQATYGVKREGNRMMWRLPQLGVGDTTTIEVMMQGTAPADRACNRVTVTSSTGVTESATKCVRVVDRDASFQPQIKTQLVAGESRSGVRLSNKLQPIAHSPKPDATTTNHQQPLPSSLPPVSGSPFSPFRPLGASSTQTPPVPHAIPETRPRHSQLDLGRPTRMSGKWQVDIHRHSGNSQGPGRTTYTVRITNRNAEVEENVLLTVESPDGSQYSNSINPPMIRDARRSSDGRTVEFLPVSSMRPDETVTFQIVVRHSGATSGSLRAKIASDRWPAGNVFTE